MGLSLKKSSFWKQHGLTIDADPGVVWGQIVRIPEIQETERSTSFYHRIGIPKPIEATLSHDGPGGIREARFEIEPRPQGGVVLHLSSRHRLTTPFNWYSSFWSDRVMQDIQETICRVVKGRSEIDSGRM